MKARSTYTPALPVSIGENVCPEACQTTQASNSGNVHPILWSHARRFLGYRVVWSGGLYEAARLVTINDSPVTGPPKDRSGDDMDVDEKDRRPAGTFSFGYPVSAFAILVLFTVVALISAVGTYRISIDGSKNLLETRAVDIAVNLGFTLERLGLKEDLFPELVRSARWDDLAFLAFYDQDGTVLLHSNPHLVGRNQKDRYLQETVKEERPVIHFATLATGEDVFVLDFPVRLHRARETRKAEPRDASEGAVPLMSALKDLLKPSPVAHVYCLRVALHPYPAQEIVRRANLEFILVGVSLVILWSLAFFFYWTWRKTYRLEVRLREQERMASLGEMAAVLAHEIRNPLSSIKGFAQYNLEGATTPDLRESLTIIVDESRRLEHLTTDLLAYARPAKLHEEDFDLEWFCRELEKSVGAEASRRLHIETSCDRAILRMDREKLMQIALNLVRNAVEAVEERPGGEILLRLEFRGNQLLLTVEENGPGLPEEVKRRMFDPFLTTKARGTGLGLAIVNRLVAAMKGSIVFKERDGNGTTVEVVMPVSAAREEK
jgi:two-component system sensor histidine kinase HydH